MEIVLDASAIIAAIADDGNSYRLLPVTHEKKSPFDNVPRVKLGITTQEIVEIIRECRAEI